MGFPEGQYAILMKQPKSLKTLKAFTFPLERKWPGQESLNPSVSPDEI